MKSKNKTRADDNKFEQDLYMDKLEEYFRYIVSQEAYDFFALFARFEYAMKKGGFRVKKGTSPAWNKFAMSLPEAFFEKVRAAPETLIFFDEPPDYLKMSDDGGVEWSGSPNSPHDAVTLFKSLKTARNNLFHGDKKHDHSRDIKSMKAGLNILNTAYYYTSQDERFSEFIAEMAYSL